MVAAYSKLELLPRVEVKMEQIRQRIMQTQDYAKDAALREASMNSFEKEQSSLPAVVQMPSPSMSRTAVDVSPKISSKDWTLASLMNRSNFKAVQRVSALLPPEQLLLVLERYERKGEPLIIEGWHDHANWLKDLFDIDWLLKHCGHHKWQIRNVRDRSDKEVSLADFIQWSRDRLLHKQSEDDELLYGKDAPCPPEWRDWVNNGDVLPSVLRPNGPADLLQNLAESEAVESLMCYLGVGDTFTPCHKDLCASSGQNIMCYTENGGSSFWFMTASSDAPAAGEYFQKQIGQELDWEEHVVTVDEFANAPFTVFVTEQKLGDLVLVPPRSCHQVVNHGGLTVKTSWSRMTLKGLETALHHELPIYRRVCRAEQYRVKYILYRTLLQRTAQIRALQREVRYPMDAPASPTSSPSNGRPLPSFATYLIEMSSKAPTALNGQTDDYISCLVKDLADLIDMFDVVLHEEYSPAHRKLPTIFPRATSPTHPGHAEVSGIFSVRTPSKRQPKLSEKASQAKVCQLGNFACDFCGADIFQSYFECMDCRPFHAEDSWSESGEPQLGDGVLICPPCYVEGRTCSCRVMDPGQCRPFADLLRDRNEAARLLSVVQPLGPRRKELFERDIWESNESNQLKIFDAACRLLQMRTEVANVIRKCRCSYSGPAFEVFRCGPCHGSKCLRDLLKQGIHSAEVMLEYKNGGNDWHAIHREIRADFKGSITGLQAAERKGTVIRRKDRLVFVAQRYQSCKPMNPHNTRPGWYDEHGGVKDGNEASRAAAGVTVLHASEAATPPQVQSHSALSLPSSTTTMSSPVQEESVVVIEQGVAMDHPPATAASAQVATDQSIASIDSSPLSSLQSNSSTSTATPSFAKLSSRRQVVYVHVPPSSMKSRTSASSAPSNRGTSSKKRASTQMDDSEETTRQEQETYAADFVSALARANGAEAPSAPVEKFSVRLKRRTVMSESPERPHVGARDGDSPPPAQKRRTTKKQAQARQQVEKPATATAGSSRNTTSRKMTSKSGIRGARGRPPGKAVVEIAPVLTAVDDVTPAQMEAARPRLVPILEPSPSASQTEITLSPAPSPNASPPTMHAANSLIPSVSRAVGISLAVPREDGLSAATSIDNPLPAIVRTFTPLPSALSPGGRQTVASATGPRIVGAPSPPSVGSVLVPEYSQTAEDTIHRAINTLSRRVMELGEDNARHSRRVLEQDMKLDDSERKFKDLDSRLHEATCKIREQEHRLDDTTRKLREQEKRANALHNANERLREVLTEQEDQLKELKGHKDRSEERVGAMESKSSELEIQVDRYAQDVKELRDVADGKLSAQVSVFTTALTDVVQQTFRRCSEQYSNSATSSTDLDQATDDRTTRERSPETPPPRSPRLMAPERAVSMDDNAGPSQVRAAEEENESMSGYQPRAPRVESDLPFEPHQYRPQQSFNSYRGGRGGGPFGQRGPPRGGFHVGQNYNPRGRGQNYRVYDNPVFSPTRSYNRSRSEYPAPRQPNYGQEGCPTGPKSYNNIGYGRPPNGDHSFYG